MRVRRAVRAPGDGPARPGPEIAGNGGAGSGVHGTVNETAMSTARPLRTRALGAPTPRPVPLTGVDGRHDGLDLRAFDHFYAEHYREVARALALTLGDAELGGEAADEAMVRAYERWSTVRDYDSPAGWTYRVGLNWARSVLRRRRRRDRLPLYDPGVTVMPELGEPAVIRALAALNDDQRAVVVCRFLLDWSVEETATALGVRPGTVQSRLHRAVRQLQARLSHLR